MKVKTIVQDVDILQNIEPEKVRNYLVNTGWFEDGDFMKNATIWHKNQPGKGEFEILLPKHKNIGDYITRISEVMETLSIFENRSQLDILSEVITKVPNQTIQGIITQVNPENLSNDIIILYGVVFNKLQKIIIELPQNHDYSLIIHAYQERLPISCTGNLEKKDNYFILKNTRNWEIYKNLLYSTLEVNSLSKYSQSEANNEINYQS